MAEISPKIAALLQEMYGKGILTEEKFLALSNEAIKTDIRYTLLGILDAQTDGNEITHQDADRYIEQMDLTTEEVDTLRSGLRERQGHKRALN